jgi:hypothetical protein
VRKYGASLAGRVARRIILPLGVKHLVLSLENPEDFVNAVSHRMTEAPNFVNGSRLGPKQSS